MVWLIIYPLLTAFILGIIKRIIADYLDFITLSIFSVYLLIVFKITSSIGSSGTEYFLGSWEKLLGIRLHLAADGIFMVWLIALLTYLILIYCSSYIQENKAKYYILIYVLTASLMGLVLTADFFNLYVFFEIASIVSYSLAAINQNRDNFEGVLKYIVVGSVGGMLVLLAIILSYKLTGTLDLAEIAIRSKNISNFQQATIKILLLVGFGSKIALVPLHAWLPDVYTNANVTFNALSSALILKTVLYSLIKVLHNLFGGAFFSSKLQIIVMMWGVITFLVAHLLAYQQQNIKRLLAYSSIAHLGYLIMVFSLGTEKGLIAANFHLLNHALMKSTLFLLSGILSLRIKSYLIRDWQGLGYKFPYSTLLFTGVSFAIIGLPPFNGFVSKWLMVQAIIDAGYVNIAFAILIGTILSLVYYLRIIKVLYSRRKNREEEFDNNYKESKRLTAVTTVLAGSCLVLGIIPGPMLELINKTISILGG